MGLLNICKLPGMSSHEVVYRVRRSLGMKRVGHTGTLDPAAGGVLPICLGVATRLADYVAAGPKSYRAEIIFGLTTASDDAEGEVLTRCDASELTTEQVTAALTAFIGPIQQRPPLRSAIWIDGQRAYHIALKGETVEMPEREIIVYTFTPVRFTPGPNPRLLADIVCGKGTYIRSLARDLGAALGVGGALSFLVRTQVGDCRLADSITLDELQAAADAGEADRMIRRADSAITYLPALTVPVEHEKFRYGVEVPMEGEPDQFYRIYLGEEFVGLGKIFHGKLRPLINLGIGG